MSTNPLKSAFLRMAQTLPAIALPLLLGANASSAQQAGSASTAQDGDSEKRPISPDDYGRWERLGGATLSEDGRWMAYTISRVDDHSELRLVELPDGLGNEVVIPFGSRATFSPDGQRIAYMIGVSPDEADAIRERGDPVRTDLAIRSLASGEVEVFEETNNFAFSPSGRYVALRRYGPSGQRDWTGVDVIVRELSTGSEMPIGNVADFEWHAEEDVMAVVWDAAGMVGNGVYLYRAEEGRLQSIDQQKTKYRFLTWREDSGDLAVMKRVVESESTWADTANTVVAWREVIGNSPKAFRLDPAAVAGLPTDMRVVDLRSIEWSATGDAIRFGVKERTAKEGEDEAEEEAAPEGQGAQAEGRAGGGGRGAGRGGAGRGRGAAEEEEKPGVEIWHAKDVDIIPTQKLRVNAARNENFLSAWFLDEDRIVTYEDEAFSSVSFSENDERAIGRDAIRWEREGMFGPNYSDLYSVNGKTGERSLEVEHVQFDLGISTTGRYHLFFEADDWWVWDAEKGARVNLTEGVDAVFTNTGDDHPVPQKPAHGRAGWTEGDAMVLLYDEFDVWAVNADGSGGERLTNGAADQVRYRVTRVETDGGPFGSGSAAFDLDRPLYFTTYGERTKKSGYARLDKGAKAPMNLVWEDARVSRLNKADGADVFVYTTERFDDSPDYYVTGNDFQGPKQVTRTNPQQDEYLWGRSMLVDYENSWGVPLQGSLIFPADYQPGRQYPMLVYHYEKRSQGLHGYQIPSKTSPYNTGVFSAEGYFVLEPDIVYRDRDPGVSAVAALVPAVEAAVRTGMIDPDRVGIVGHSWGGYQTTFSVTATDVFAAAVAGAPLTNMVSMYLSMYWNSGGTDARIFEISQGRMEVPPWEDMESYIRNSPMHNIENMNTPILVTFGTEDGAVEFNQGVEFYNAARRAEKDMVMLVYEGENHSLSREPNQLDYHKRILEWFGHYLKGEPAPKWITEGMTYLEQEEALGGGGRGGGGGGRGGRGGGE